MDLRTLPPGAAPTPSPVGQVPWGPRGVALGIAAFAGVFIAAIAFLAVGLIVEDPAGTSDLELSTGLIVATTLLLQAGTLAVAIFFGPWQTRAPISLLGFRPLPRGSLMRWAAVALGASLTVSVGWVWFAETFAPGLAPPELSDDLGLGTDAAPVMLIFAYIVVGLGAPLAEEVFDRGFVFAGLIARWGVWPAILGSASVFAVAHLSPGLMVPAFLSGVIFAWVYWRSGSLWTVIVAHVAQNSLAFAGMVLA